ncbi:TIGR01777 family oxidoreductase [Vibrio sp. ZSDE26]|uniref:TIGR01777 family oxidoreductase n=1 Tax=Vibrio amylolyticus TaxID=2847292 RepID=A0A9X2BFV3_9VIBR|nr:TIGR01777 family oxidoreductase [Vibrio amylolyticus]MCK6262206.1 TIGR01777 family oxidoreductase [Vibrio amylolyticus]
MKILITGGTGFIGQELLKSLITHQVVILTRNIERAKQTLSHISSINLSFVSSLNKLQQLNDFDAIINLAGEPIADKRWSKQQKEKICDSRWEITEKLVALIHASTSPPSVFISGSAVGYYGDQQSHPFDESLHVSQENFPHKVCEKWESIAKRARSEQTRVCVLRTGVVLHPSGGALSKMLPVYKLGLGGAVGSGQQYMPWIHMIDMVRAINHLLDTHHADGEFNLTAPHPVTNQDFSKALAKTLKRPHILFTPDWLIKLMLGECAMLLLDSVRCKPKKLTDLGFRFTYSRIDPALKNLLHHQG